MTFFKEMPQQSVLAELELNFVDFLHSLVDLVGLIRNFFFEVLLFEVVWEMRFLRRRASTKWCAT